LDDNVLQYQFSPQSNLDEVSQNSSYKTVCQGIELAEHGDPAVNPVNEEKHTGLVNLHNEHEGAVSVDRIENEVHNSPGGAGAAGLQPERQIILKKLKELFSTRQQEAFSSQECVDSSSDHCVPDGTQVNANLSCDPFGATVDDKASFEEPHGDFTEVSMLFSLFTFFLSIHRLLLPYVFVFCGTVVPLILFLIFLCSCDKLLLI